jgi:hypothetical protein
MEVCEVKYLQMLLRELGCPQEEPDLDLGRQQDMHSFGGERELIDREVQAYQYKIQIRDRDHF